MNSESNLNIASYFIVKICPNILNIYQILISFFQERLPDILELRELLPSIRPILNNQQRIKSKRSEYKIRRRTKSHKKRKIFNVKKVSSLLKRKKPSSNDGICGNEATPYLDNLSRRSRRSKYLLRALHSASCADQKPQKSQPFISVHLIFIYFIFFFFKRYPTNGSRLTSGTVNDFT